MRRPGRLIAGLVALIWTGSALAADGPSTPATLFQQARNVLDHQAALARLWPGYWPEGQAFILHDRAVGVVFAGGASPSGPSFRPGRLESADAAFELDYPSGVPNTVAFAVQGPDSDLETLFHEQFHDYQHQAFRWRGPSAGEYVDLSLIPDLAGFAAAAEVERRVLADALQAGDDASRRRLARTYLRLRRDRIAALDGAVAVVEAEREWSEGTAFYVGLQASALVHGKSDAAVRDRLVAELRQNLFARPGGFVTNWFRWRAYGVGGAEAWLLDAMGADWRGSVEDGERLNVLLERKVGLAAPRFAENARRRYNLPGLRNAVVAAMAAAPPVISSRAQFLASAPRRLVVELDIPARRAGRMETGFQSAGMAPIGEGVLALPDAVYFVATGEGARLKTAGLSVLHETPTTVAVGGVGHFRFTVLLDDFAGLEAVDALPPGTHRLDRLSLRAEGLELDVEGPVEVEVSQDEILVRPVIAP